MSEMQVVLVTIDGMRGDYLGNADAYHLKIPNLRRFMRKGSYSPRTVMITKGADGHPAWTAIVAPNRGLGSLYRDGKALRVSERSQRRDARARDQRTAGMDV